MATYAARHREAAALYQFAVFLRAGARALTAAARQLDAWLETRRLAAAARADLSEMTDRELLDIGLSRADIKGVAKGWSPRTTDERIKAITFAASMRS